METSSTTARTSAPPAQAPVASPPTTSNGPSSADLAAQREAAYQQQQLTLLNQCMTNAQKAYDDQVALENRYKDSMQRLNTWGPGMEQVHQQTLTHLMEAKLRSEQVCT
ncbi:MAG: hypothetical protein ACKOIA_05375, partial [Acidimicrobiia bacterium]